MEVDSTSVWQQALPGWEYRFPRDHAVHSNFKTEWWYFTGNLTNGQGHAYGFELTFFRQGVFSLSAQKSVEGTHPVPNRFVQNDFKFAHFAVSDISGGKFCFTQKISRGAFGEAGFGSGIPTITDAAQKVGSKPLAWIEDWSLTPQPDGSWNIAAKAGGATPMSIDLRVMPSKDPVIEGTDGVSQKAEGIGNASHYYSFTRLKTTGTLALGKDASKQAVTGESWFDHEWASNQLGPDQVGWDWFSFQFDDGTELMLYAMRRRDGTVDPVSSGTWVDVDGRTEHLQKRDFQLRALRHWPSSQTGAKYPVEWQVTIPAHELDLRLKPRLDNQELVLPLISYWEGAITAEGQRKKQAVKGVGYMELTGYAAAMKGLQGSEKATHAASAQATR